MTMHYDFPPHPNESSQSDRPPMPPPWMPLDALVDLWAAYGKVATSIAACKAVSAAFTALAEEREALQDANTLTKQHESSTGARFYGRPLPFISQELVLESLRQAAAHWFEAACALSQQARIPLVYETLELLPPGLDLRTLIGSALLQRERVWAIAHALLVEQVRPYRDLVAEEIIPASADHPEDEVQA